MAHPHEYFQRGYRSPNALGWASSLLFALVSLGWVLSAIADWHRHAMVVELRTGVADIDFAGLTFADDFVRLAGFPTLLAQVAAAVAYGVWFLFVNRNCESLLVPGHHEKPRRRRFTEVWQLSDPRPGAVRKGPLLAWQWSWTAAVWTYCANSWFGSTGLSAEELRTTALVSTAIALLAVISTSFAFPVVRGISRAQSDPAKFFGGAPASAV